MHASAFTKGQQRQAFTLIELLTVIAIIGILAAILIPVVGAVRLSAREAKSLSNLRQIGVSLHLYADEHNDRFPPGYFFRPGEGERIWTTELLPYLGLEAAPIADESIFVSPLAQIPVRDQLTSSIVVPSTYSAHGLLMQNISGEDTRLRRFEVFRPSQVILIGEGTQRSNNTYSNATFGTPSAWRIAGSGENLREPIPTEGDVDGVGGFLRYRGNNSAPVLFVDGHVESMRKGTVTFGNLIADR